MQQFKPTKKDWHKAIKHITDPYYAESLITQLEAKRRQLLQITKEFKSETPMS